MEDQDGTTEKGQTAAQPKKRSVWRWVFIFLGVPVGALALLIVVMLSIRPYWDLRGNFLPTFDFESSDAHYERLEANRAAQRYDAPDQAAAIVETEDTWPTFRGPALDGVSPERGLLKVWREEGPPELYRQPIGGGYAGFVIGGGRAFTIEQRRENEAVVCYDFATGRELWSVEYSAAFIEQMGGDGPRATPTLDGDRLYALGASGVFQCLDAVSGEVVWKTDILGEGAIPNLEWGMASSPLIVGDNVVVTNSGLAGDSVLAFDKKTGDAAWSSIAEKQAYTSLIETTLAGRRQLLNMSATQLNGLDAETGERLWSFPWATTNGINCSQPIVVDENRVFVSAGYGHGAVLIELKAGEKGLVATELWANKTMKNKFNSSVLYEGHIYGLDEGILACVEVETGKRKWKGGRFGHGQLLLADGNLIVLGERGQLALVQAQPGGFEQISEFQALKGKTWNLTALAGGRLLVRNTKEMVCYDLRAEEGS